MLEAYLDAIDIRDLARMGAIRPREIVQFYINRVRRLNPSLGALWLIAEERAMADADRLEKLAQPERDRLPLFGVPYTLKDLTVTADMPTTFGSRNYEHFQSTVDSEVAVRLRRAGGILLGKTTTPELGGRPTTEGGLHPPARNPWNLDYTAGGSSGGAAAAVAAGLGPIAAGTDGGGSIRIPASCCGLVGIKPARGRITHAPVQGEGWCGLATSGPIARTVRDAALMLDLMAGPVLGDPYGVEPPLRPFVEAAAQRPIKLRIGAIESSAMTPVNPEVSAAFSSACETFRAMGHEVETMALDPIVSLNEPMNVVICAGIATYQIQNPDWMDPIVRRLHERGHAISAPQLVIAMRQMHNAAREIVRVMAPYDAVVTPTIACLPTRIGAMPTRPEAYGQEVMAWLSFTAPVNATGLPAIALPAATSSSGLPIGIQLIGRPADESGIIALAAAYEEACPWSDRRPPIA
jgi:amidase